MAENDKLIIHKGRTNIVPLSLGFDASTDTITSEIRSASDELIATFTVVPDGDGTDGEYIMTLDNTITTAITHTTGLMDVKRVSAGEPLPVFDMPIEVEFRETITV
jgi:hypothetical protein